MFESIESIKDWLKGLVVQWRSDPTTHEEQIMVKTPPINPNMLNHLMLRHLTEALPELIAKEYMDKYGVKIMKKMNTNTIANKAAKIVIKELQKPKKKATKKK